MVVFYVYARPKMLFPEAGLKVWLYSEAADMRKSFDGLMTLAKNKMHENPVSGELFVFINRRQTQVKILYFDRSGYCIWMKRLEEGSFKKPLASTANVRTPQSLRFWLVVISSGWAPSLPCLVECWEL